MGPKPAGFGALLLIAPILSGCVFNEPVVCSYDLKKTSTLAQMVSGDVWWTHSQIIEGQGTTRSDVLIEAAEDAGIDPKSIPTSWDKLDSLQVRLGELSQELRAFEVLDDQASQLLGESAREVQKLSSMITLGNLASKGPSINSELKVQQDSARGAIEELLDRCAELEALENRS